MNFKDKVKPKDLIGAAALGYCLYLIGQGINHIVSGIAIMVVTYYFSKRLYEEQNGNGNKK